MNKVLSEINVERIETNMSYMTILANHHGVVIASDSRDNLIINGSKHKYDNLQKVFISEDKKTIAGITGYYGDERHNVLEDIKEIVLSSSCIEEKCFLLSLYVSKHNIPAYINIFLAVYSDDVIKIVSIDMYETTISVKEIEPAYVGIAGSNMNVNHLVIVQDIVNLELDMLVKTATKAVDKAITIDILIEQNNCLYDRTIGGSHKWVSMDVLGNISGNILLDV